MNRRRSSLNVLLACGAVALLAATLGAEQDGDKAAAGDQSQKLDRMMERRRPTAPVKPIGRGVVEAEMPGAPAAAPGRSGIDAEVLGIAPGQTSPRLRREGEFVPLRRGRLARAGGGSQVMFVFDGDGKASPEPPMIIMPCAALEHMERLVAEQGDKLVFRLSGQIYRYRGSNYILPSIWNIPPDQGNLRQ
ncbi:MAG: hypothetical protein CMJ18_22945 [Phycisphaeraceae bacterium]|jgi:hypothetical protein|nr:hypothetical protein [Phycisphaeraceae bacterium]